MANETSTKIGPVGSWTTWNFTPTATAKKVFADSLGKIHVGAKYFDMFAFRQQTVNGINYRFLCAADRFVFPESTYLAEGEVHVAPDGSVHILWIHEVGPMPGFNVIGGWQNWRFPASPEAVAALNAAPHIGSDFTPHGSTGQLVAGMNYCLVCEQKLLIPGIPGIFASLVHVYQDLQGKSQITAVHHID